jgi:hypothetical protein
MPNHIKWSDGNKLNGPTTTGTTKFLRCNQSMYKMHKMATTTVVHNKQSFSGLKLAQLHRQMALGQQTTYTDPPRLAIFSGTTSQLPIWSRRTVSIERVGDIT